MKSTDLAGFGQRSGSIFPLLYNTPLYPLCPLSSRWVQRSRYVFILPLLLFVVVVVVCVVRFDCCDKVLHALQMWSRKSAKMTYMNLKGGISAIEKDKVCRASRQAGSRSAGG